MIATARRLGRLAGLVPIGAAAATTTLSAYLAVSTVVGLPRPSKRTVVGPRRRFLILVPAHDEEIGIGRMLASCDSLDYPRDRFAVHVVADNCTDRTTERVRTAGWEAHERDDPDQPGKGPALNWLFDRLDSRETFDAVVIVDADTSLDRQFLTAMDEALDSGAVVAQGRYLVSDPDASAAASFRYAALACRHHLRPLARRRLGASCGLYGNGMAFERDVLRHRSWTGHLVEDAEFQMQLLLDGLVVEYVPEAVLHAEMPDTLDASVTQNARWERGRVDLIGRFVPSLARQFPRAKGRRLAVLDGIIDLLLPPISVLVAAQTFGAVASMPQAVLGSRRHRLIVRCQLAGLSVVVAHTIAGLVAVRAPLIHFRNLAAAPRIVAWKVALWLRTLCGGSEISWIRTVRNHERTDSGGTQT
ncbi:MAG: glycosyltransferase family 2 protein [Ilumatobacteraceae bacterium]|nr:glycosyltransferase family 2 protein [Ilumatobacteraceae bacterium]